MERLATLLVAAVVVLIASLIALYFLRRPPPSPPSPTPAPLSPSIRPLSPLSPAKCACKPPRPFCTPTGCAQCLTDGHCEGDKPYCVDGTCVACRSDKDCDGKFCDPGTRTCRKCLPPMLGQPTRGCPQGLLCLNGDSCVQCITDTDCDRAAPHCKNNACIQCRDDTDCSAPNACFDNKCRLCPFASPPPQPGEAHPYTIRNAAAGKAFALSIYDTDACGGVVLSDGLPDQVISAVKGSIPWKAVQSFTVRLLDKGTFQLNHHLGNTTWEPARFDGKTTLFALVTQTPTPGPAPPGPSPKPPPGPSPKPPPKPKPPPGPGPYGPVDPVIPGGGGIVIPKRRFTSAPNPYAGTVWVYINGIIVDPGMKNMIRASSKKCRDGSATVIMVDIVPYSPTACRDPAAVWTFE